MTSSRFLRNLTPKPYLGKPLLDANQRPIAVMHVITVQFVAGSPEGKLEVDMCVIEDLAYSCIIGTPLLAKLNSWGVDNTKSTLHLKKNSHEQP